MSLPEFTLDSEIEKGLYDFLVALNIKVHETQDRYEDDLSPKLKEARQLMREDPLYSLFHIPSESFHNRKKDWGSLFGKNFEKLVGILLKQYIPDPLPEGFELPRNQQLCDYPVILGGKKYAIEVKNRFGTADRKIQEDYLRMYDDIKKIEEGEWEPMFLIRLEDNHPTAIKKWSQKGWKIYEGEAMNNFIIRYTGFDLNKFLNKITLPRLREDPNTEATLGEFLKK